MNLIERLRTDFVNIEDAEDAMSRAADEIERLQKELQLQALNYLALDTQAAQLTAERDALLARQMPDHSIDMLVEAALEHVHDDNGAGDVYCLVCSGHIKMRWKNGARLDKYEEFPHSDGCPVVWARYQVAARKV